MNWQMIGVICGFISVFVAIITHAVIAAYWAGQMASTIKALVESVKNLQSRDDLFVKKDDYLTQVAGRNKEIGDIWKAQNELRNKFEDCRAANAKCGMK